MRPLFEPFAEAALPPRDQVPGVGSAAIRTERAPFAVAISWEIFFSRRVREGVRDGGQIVLNPTNGSSYWLTQIQSQQLAASALRAAESGRWVLQAAPTGFSAVFDQDGTILDETGISEQEVLVADVPRLTITTPGAAPAATCPGTPGWRCGGAAVLGRPRWRQLRDRTRSTGRRGSGEPFDRSVDSATSLVGHAERLLDPRSARRRVDCADRRGPTIRCASPTSPTAASRTSAARASTPAT